MTVSSSTVQVHIATFIYTGYKYRDDASVNALEFWFEFSVWKSCFIFVNWWPYMYVTIKKKLKSIIYKKTEGICLTKLKFFINIVIALYCKWEQCVTHDHEFFQGKLL